MAPYRIRVREALENAGIELDDVNAFTDSILPAVCSEGCEVEPDGVCEHGFPSVLLDLGVI